MRVVFMGTSEFAEPALRELIKEHEILAVYTAPDRPAGRGMKTRKGAVRTCADAAGIPVRTPLRLDIDEVGYLKSLRPDVITVVSYGLKIPGSVLELPEYCVINAHASLLPRHRGASPINAAILAGDRESGVTVFRLNEEWDAGEMVHKKKITLDIEETASSLWEKLRHLSAEAFLEALEMFENGTAEFLPQDESEVSYAHKIKKDDGLIDWNDEALNIERKIRGYYSWPMAFTFFDNRMLKVHAGKAQEKGGAEIPGTVVSADKNGIVIACGKGRVRLHRIQLQNKRAMDCGDFLNGNDLRPGMRLGNPSP